MGKVEFDIVKPNLQIRHYESRIGDDATLVYSLERAEDVVKSARAINDVVKRHINEVGLRVREDHFKVIKHGGSYDGSESFSFPLDMYLNVFDERDEVGVITNNSAKLFGLNYNVQAYSYENPGETIEFVGLRRDLIESDKKFDEWENKGVRRLDRVKSLKNMKRRFEELDPKVPNQIVTLDVITVRNYFGFIYLASLRDEGKEKIDVAESELIEKLKEFEGPCLSYDAFDLFVQYNGLFYDANKLVSKYGDILLNKDWKNRFFRFDP